jgi:hypothetical protein
MNFPDVPKKQEQVSHLGNLEELVYSILNNSTEIKEMVYLVKNNLFGSTPKPEKENCYKNQNPPVLFSGSIGRLTVMADDVVNNLNEIRRILEDVKYHTKTSDNSPKAPPISTGCCGGSSRSKKIE